MERIMSDLKGKAALVTGASRGIGRGIALRLARDGADVAITYVSSPDKAEAVVAEITKLGRRAVAIKADSADAASVTASVDKAHKEFGKLDILVNNAGIAAGGPFDQMALADVDRLISVNVRSVVLASQAAAKVMGQGGRIISIGSCLAERAGMPGITVYAMTKAALVGLTKGMARDLGSRGITVNIVHPGPIDTDMNPADGANAEKQKGMLALGSYGKVEDIAGAVAYLADPRSSFVTGTEIAVDGGFRA
jgi:3-oxoacyl-[acyl-carrier protein] reductase